MRHLITTADELSWVDDRSVLFLGEWCKRYSRRNWWKPLDSITAEYHWDDRAKLYQDYLYLQELYERLLPSISKTLNQYHNVEHTVAYWRIVVGFWLNWFIHVLFDRWTMIKLVYDEHNISGTTILNINNELVTPQNASRFFSFVRARHLEPLGLF